MKKSILIFAVILSNALTTLAQGMLTGRVVDEKKEPIMYATVRAFKDTQFIGATVTDSAGNFEINSLNPSLYSIVALSLGYDSSVIKDLLVSNNKATYARFILKPHRIICFPKVIREYTVPLIDIENPSKRTYTREEINQMPR